MIVLQGKLHQCAAMLMFRFAFLPLLLCPLFLPAETITVRDAAALRDLLSKIKPDTVLKIAPGNYGGGYSVREVSGLTIEALDAAKPPVFQGGKEAWHFTRCMKLTLRNIRCTGQSANGINLDDGDQLDAPVKGITLEGLRISETGPTGNHDAIKVSGLEGLTIRNCVIEGWAGQAIDMVGCRKSLITGCEIRGKQGFSQTTGIQTKGGSSEIVIEKCRFFDAGMRPLNIGGSTGMPYFRPQGVKYEARDITVRECTIEGGDCATAFVGVDGAFFHDNAILFPKKWVFRVLQETRAEGFAPCRKVTIENNRIVFRRAEVRTEINIGVGTEPASFVFRGNRWFAEDEPARSMPGLPVEEKEGRYGKDPR